MPATTFWTPSENELFIKLVTGDTLITFQELATRLRKTRSSISGKVARRRSKGFGTPAIREPAAPARAQAKGKRKPQGFSLPYVRKQPIHKEPPTVVKESPRPAEPLLPPETWAEAGCCTFIYGNPLSQTWIMCGHPVAQGRMSRSFCQPHYNICYTKMPPRRGGNP